VRLAWFAIDPLEKRHNIPPTLNGFLFGIGVWFIDAAWGLNLLRYAQCLWKLNKSDNLCLYFTRAFLFVLLITDVLVQVSFNMAINSFHHDKEKRHTITTAYYILASCEVLGYTILGSVVLSGILSIPKNFRSETTKFIIRKVKAFLILGASFLVAFGIDLSIGAAFRPYREAWWKFVVTRGIEWSFCAAIIAVTCWRQKVPPSSIGPSTMTYGSTTYWPGEDFSRRDVEQIIGNTTVLITTENELKSQDAPPENAV